eukprot:gb/GEZN01004730.1/.p1 GENE.gb/GEZN01004730.1/~~gb/GEZN01004730.1/.p1  ORF type:complete len:423 (+),score=47.46 gb/GEZN01004730.1/:185-1453(+)
MHSVSSVIFCRGPLRLCQCLSAPPLFPLPRRNLSLLSTAGRRLDSMPVVAAPSWSLRRGFSSIGTDKDEVILMENGFLDRDAKLPTPKEEALLARKWAAVQRSEQLALEIQALKDKPRREAAEKKQKQMMEQCKIIKKTVTKDGMPLTEDLDNFLAAQTETGVSIFPEHMRQTLRYILMDKIEKALKKNPAIKQGELENIVFTLSIKHGFALAKDEEERLNILCPTAPGLNDEIELPAATEKGVVAYRHLSWDGYGDNLTCFLTLGLVFPTHSSRIFDHSFYLESENLTEIYEMYRDKLGICSPSDKSWIQKHSVHHDSRFGAHEPMMLPPGSISISPSVVESTVTDGKYAHLDALGQASHDAISKAAAKDPSYAPFLYPLKVPTRPGTAAGSKPPGYPHPATFKAPSIRKESSHKKETTSE